MADFSVFTDYYHLVIPALIFLVVILNMSNVYARLLDIVSVQVLMRIKCDGTQTSEAKIRLFKDMEHQAANRPLEILEVGAGDCKNFTYYPAGSKVSIVEPNTSFHPSIRKRIAELGSHLQVDQIVSDVAERLERVADDSVDAYVMTYVMCVVSDVTETLAQAYRVLRKVSFTDILTAVFVKSQVLRNGGPTPLKVHVTPLSYYSNSGNYSSASATTVQSSWFMPLIHHNTKVYMSV